MADGIDLVQARRSVDDSGSNLFIHQENKHNNSHHPLPANGISEVHRHDHNHQGLLPGMAEPDGP
jgi:hypothetical protein